MSSFLDVDFDDEAHLIVYDCCVDVLSRLVLTNLRELFGHFDDYGF